MKLSSLEEKENQMFTYVIAALLLILVIAFFLSPRKIRAGTPPSFSISKELDKGNRSLGTQVRSKSIRVSSGLASAHDRMAEIREAEQRVINLLNNSDRNNKKGRG